MRKRVLVLAALALSSMMSISAYAGEWKQDNTGWWYQNDDGSYPTNTWQEIDGKQYYFGNDGYMFHDTTTPDGYQVGSDGAWIQDNNTTSENKSDGEAFTNLVYPVDVIDGGFTVNSVGGISPGIAFRNNSGKTIEYISFEMTPYNRVGDPVKCTIRDYSTTTCKATGPYEPDEGVGSAIYSLTSGLVLIYDRNTDAPYYYTSLTHEKAYLSKKAYAKTVNHMPGWECTWYNSDIHSIKVTKAIVEYMDGSSDTINCDVLMFRDRFDR